VAEFSRANVGKVGAVFVDGKLVSAPTILGEFSVLAVFSGDFSEAEAERIAKGIKGD
jgi:preprotein translocase subunit SecD